MDKKIVDLSNLFLEVGGKRITGFGADAITIPMPTDGVVKSKSGLDSVAWLKLNPLAQEIPVTINLLADSSSIKFLKAFEKAGLVVTFRFEWEELGIYIEALDARVEEKGELKVSSDMPEIQFLITIKNFAEIKGI